MVTKFVVPADGRKNQLCSFHSVFHRFELANITRKTRGKGLVTSENHSFFKALPEGYLAEIPRRTQMTRGPRRILTGKKSMALNNSKTPCTAIPRMRNGSVRSQTMGYSTSASSASGQQRMNRMHQRKKAAIATSLGKAGARSIFEMTATEASPLSIYEIGSSEVSLTLKPFSLKRLATETGTSALRRMYESSTSEWSTRPSA